jgi:phosphohistidine phosphatase
VSCQRFDTGHIGYESDAFVVRRFRFCQLESVIQGDARAMKLYFLRHGKAEERTAGASDYERRLTSEGIEEMKQVAQGILALVDEVDLILSSPLPRALETARIAAAALAVPSDKLIVSDKLAAGAFGLGSLQSLVEHAPADQRIMLVGHEPDFSTVVMRLTGANIDMKKAGLACIEVPRIGPDNGVLRWLLTPRQLQLVGRTST